MRGYEDRGFAADRIAIADVRLNYPIIVDSGFASSLIILPSFFLRQLDVDAFATGPSIRPAPRLATPRGRRIGHPTHAVLGGAAVNALPAGKRLRDDRALVHFIGLAAL